MNERRVAEPKNDVVKKLERRASNGRSGKSCVQKRRDQMFRDALAMGGSEHLALLTAIWVVCTEDVTELSTLCWLAGLLSTLGLCLVLRWYVRKMLRRVNASANHLFDVTNRERMRSGLPPVEFQRLTGWEDEELRWHWRGTHGRQRKTLGLGRR